MPHLTLLIELVDEGPAYKARANDPQPDRELGQVEAAMNRSQRPHAVPLVDQHRDVVL